MGDVKKNWSTCELENIDITIEELFEQDYEIRPGLSVIEEAFTGTELCWVRHLVELAFLQQVREKREKKNAEET